MEERLNKLEKNFSDISSDIKEIKQALLGSFETNSPGLIENNRAQSKMLTEIKAILIPEVRGEVQKLHDKIDSQEIKINDQREEIGQLKNFKSSLYKMLVGLGTIMTIISPAIYGLVAWAWNYLTGNHPKSP